MHRYSMLRFVVVASTSSKQIKKIVLPFLSELYLPHYFVILLVLVFYRLLCVFMWLVDHSSSVIFLRVGD